VSDIVAIEDIGSAAVPEQQFLDPMGQRGLAGS